MFQNCFDFAVGTGGGKGCKTNEQTGESASDGLRFVAANQHIRPVSLISVVDGHQFPISMATVGLCPVTAVPSVDACLWTGK